MIECLLFGSYRSSVYKVSLGFAVLCSQALDFLQQNSRRLQFVRTQPLPVSGAFHTELMESATEPLREVLRQVEVSPTSSFFFFFKP